MRLFRFLIKHINVNLLCLIIGATIPTTTLAVTPPINFNVENTLMRNSILIGRTLAKNWGIDSLGNFLSNKNICLYFQTDSIGNVMDLDLAMLWTYHDRSITNRSRTILSDEQRLQLKAMFRDAGIRLGICFEPMAPDRSTFDHIVDDLVAFYKSELGRKKIGICGDMFPDLIIKRQTSWSGSCPEVRSYNPDSVLLEPNAFYKILSTSISCYPIGFYDPKYVMPDFSREIKNNATLILAMIYVFGDYMVDKWMQNNTFTVDLTIDRNGCVNEISNKHELSPIDESDLMELQNFLIKYNVRFFSDPQSSDPTETIRIELPGMLRNEEIHILDRISARELRLRTILNHNECF